MKDSDYFRIKAAIFLFSIFSLTLVSCQRDFYGYWPYSPPPDIGDGLETGTLESVDIDSEMIAKITGRIHHGKYSEVHSILIHKDGKLVFEEYYQGHRWQWDAPYHHGEHVQFERNMLHNIHSANKSLTSACIGIAVDKGFIRSVHQSIFDYLPDHRHLATQGRENTTIEHLLTMTAGLEWREWSAPYNTTDNPIVNIWFQERDPVTFILDMPMISTPGTSFNYSTGNMILLGEILRNASGLSIDQFMEQYLLAPLGVDTALWPEIYPNGVYNNTLWITPRAMVKFGVTNLNNGVWNGDRIISADWVEKSASPYAGNTRINVPAEPSGKMGYSYSWWTKTFWHSGHKVNMYTASGFGGQHIMILPELEAVVVFTGGNYYSKRPPFEILERFILPSMYPR